MTCVVLKHKEDPWFLKVQKDSIQKIYGIELLVAGYEDSDYKLDITLEYKSGCTRFPYALLEGVRQLIILYPNNLLFFEGDMIPNKKIDFIPSIRQYFGTIWPSVLYTGDKQIDTSEIWDNWKKMNIIFKDFKRIPFIRHQSKFETIGGNSEFLHPQAGCRGRSDTKKLSDFKDFVKEHMAEM